MAATSADAGTFPQTEPLESGTPSVAYPAPTAPPKRDLYPEKVAPFSEVVKPAAPQPDVLTSSSFDPTPSIPERQPMVFSITVTDPVKETVDGMLPGTKSSFHTYCVNTIATMPSYRPESTVRRRFRDFVDLSNLLSENYRGYFVPPRPHRSWYQGKLLMRPSFIEERRVLLERYLKALVSHPTISQSDELRIFLEISGPLAHRGEWQALHTVHPSFLEGTTKFFRQMIGKERITPSVTEVSKPASMRKDFVWSFRNSIKNLDDRRRPPLYEGAEFELREERTRMEEFKKDVDAAWKWATYWMDRTDAAARATDNIAAAFTALSEYEANERYVRLEALGIVGKGASRVQAIYRRGLQEASSPLSTLYNYTELMRPVLSAMKSREQALNTVQMLERDLETKRTKVRQLEIEPKKQAKADQMKEDIKALEASLIAAQAYYDRVARNNQEETERFRSYRSEDWMEMLKTLSKAEHRRCVEMQEVWTELAKELGADAATINAAVKTQ